MLWRNQFNGVTGWAIIAAMLLAAGIARADYPFAAVPSGAVPAVRLDFDPKALPDKPGCRLVKAKLTIADKTVPFDFQLYLPPGFPKLIGFEGGGVPVVVSLHNRAGIGGDDYGILGESLPSLLAEQDADGRAEGEKPEHQVRLHRVAPMICIAPHCPDGYSWESPGMAQAVGLLIDAVVPALHADPDRVCLTGFSYGASSTWVIAQQIPDRFAAIAPCDGRRTDDPKLTAERLKHVAIYLTAGDNDGDFTNDARAMCAGLAAGQHPNFVYREWHGGNHFIYGSTYSDPIFWTWLQGQKRAPLDQRQPSAPPANPPAVIAAAVVIQTPPKAPTARLVIDEKSWPDKAGYSSLHGTALIEDQSKPFTVSIFLPRIFAVAPANLPVVVSLQNRGDGGAGHLGHERAGLATLLRSPAPVAEPNRDFPAMNLATEARFIALIPHLPPGADWNTPGVPELLNDLIERTIAHYKANARSVSLTGIGSGGTAAWSLAAALPHRFAAVAVIDANPPADPKTTAATLPEMGIYLAVGEHDQKLIAQTQPLHEALSTGVPTTGAPSIGPHRDFIWALIPDDIRAVSTTLYEDPHFWAWLLSHHSK
jgi:predicted peptidase